jgi:23S rRNA (guanine2445-N2)-methyltransferase / 23S rRNA (guanine2069-N7)-methyltransferase
LADLKPEDQGKPVIFILNPPYGERLQAEQGLARLYQEMGQVFRQFDKAEINIISANPDLLHRLRLDRFDKKPVKNGPLDCLFVRFRVSTPKKATSPEPVVERVDHQLDLSEDARALKNRLSKNDKHLSKWAKRQGVDCYRLYDADLPEFAFALDRYRNALNPDQCWYHLQEYQAPKNVEETKAAARIETAKSVIVELFGIPESDLFCKTRRRQRGSEQYEKLDHQAELFQVQEGDARLLINLSDYLDSGLFLDHRTTRQMVQQVIKGKSLLNLFCYTGSVSVQAALAGASSVTSADMSATYINWCRENFEINDLHDEKRYQFIQADCLDLLKVPGKYLETHKYDVIFLDPPSFSNSKRMQQTLDIQRDHQEMIVQSMKLLSEGGQLFFSTNKKGFKLDKSLLERFAVTDITPKTIPEDFKRRPKIHQCWIIQARSA